MVDYRYLDFVKMFSSGPSYPKLKTNLRLSINRLKLLEKKKTELAQKARKEIADYISTGKIERAKIRVEHIIREDYLVEAMEVTEMYCDLVLARFGLIQQMKDLDPGMSEAISSLVWCAPRLMTDVPELKVVADQFALKYGKPYAMACRDQSISTISEKLIHKLSLQAPPKVLVEKYLQEIASNYNLEYTPDPQVMQEAEVGMNPLINLEEGGKGDGDGGASGYGGGASGYGGGGGGGIPQQPFSFPNKVPNDSDIPLPLDLNCLHLGSPTVIQGQNGGQIFDYSGREANAVNAVSRQLNDIEVFNSSVNHAEGTTVYENGDTNGHDSVTEAECHGSVDIPITGWAPCVLLTNPQSLTNCFSDFKSLIFARDPHVIVVSETWFSPSRPASQFRLKGYKLFHDDREEGRRGGGVAVYVKTRITTALLPSENVVDVQPHVPDVKVPHELECLWICVGGNTFVCGVYHAPSAPTGKLLLDHIVNTILDLRRRHGSDTIRIIVAGDFNHLACDRLNAALGVRNLVQEPTHLNSTIDLILTDTPEHYNAPILLPPLHHSKHNCVMLCPKI
ncbi:Vacuolar protein sorting-associated protein Ist1 [Trinorchestia longiramus]|nr:Vacuolar protein sorting-associated protein Ist1 [Trinorchestia longiramus]